MSEKHLNAEECVFVCVNSFIGKFFQKQIMAQRYINQGACTDSGFVFTWTSIRDKNQKRSVSSRLGSARPHGSYSSHTWKKEAWLTCFCSGRERIVVACVLKSSASVRQERKRKKGSDSRVKEN